MRRRRIKAALKALGKRRRRRGAYVVHSAEGTRHRPRVASPPDESLPICFIEGGGNYGLINALYKMDPDRMDAFVYATEDDLRAAGYVPESGDA